jgi:hypothetical protein
MPTATELVYQTGVRAGRRCKPGDEPRNWERRIVFRKGYMEGRAQRHAVRALCRWLRWQSGGATRG